MAPPAATTDPSHTPQNTNGDDTDKGSPCSRSTKMVSSAANASWSLEPR